jgi:hypothetical protein
VERAFGSHRGQMPDLMIAAFLPAPSMSIRLVSLD